MNVFADLFKNISSVSEALQNFKADLQATTLLSNQISNLKKFNLTAFNPLQNKPSHLAK